jgi:hypothetical protein
MKAAPEQVFVAAIVRAAEAQMDVPDLGLGGQLL